MATACNPVTPSPAFGRAERISFLSQLQRLSDARKYLAALLSLAVCRPNAPAASGCRGKAAAPAKSKIDFVRDVEPILHTKCYECHGSGMQMNGLRFDQKEAALKGGYSGPAIVAGGSDKSPLILRVASAKDGFKMPPAGPALTAREIGVLRAWIDQGAPWPDVPLAPPGRSCRSPKGDPIGPSNPSSVLTSPLCASAPGAATRLTASFWPSWSRKALRPLSRPTKPRCCDVLVWTSPDFPRRRATLLPS